MNKTFALPILALSFFFSSLVFFMGSAPNAHAASTGKVVYVEHIYSNNYKHCKTSKGKAGYNPTSMTIVRRIFTTGKVTAVRDSFAARYTAKGSLSGGRRIWEWRSFGFFNYSCRAGSPRKNSSINYTLLKNVRKNPYYQSALEDDTTFRLWNASSSRLVTTWNFWNKAYSYWLPPPNR